MSFNSAEELIKWCGSSEIKIKSLLDGMLDKLDVKNKSVRSILTKGSKILNEIEELKKEIELEKKIDFFGKKS